MAQQETKMNVNDKGYDPSQHKPDNVCTIVGFCKGQVDGQDENTGSLISEELVDKVLNDIR